MILVHEYVTEEVLPPKRFVVEINARELQVLHAGMLWLDSALNPEDELYDAKYLAINKLWEELDALRESAGIRVMSVV